MRSSEKCCSLVMFASFIGTMQSVNPPESVCLRESIDGQCVTGDSISETMGIHV